jgi:hypothetical protein
MLALALSVVVINQVQADGSQTDEAKKAEAFYQKINETILPRSELFLKRVDCIIRELKSDNVIARINQTSYDFAPDGDGGFEVILVDESAFNADLQASLDGANFSCTAIGYCAIILIARILVCVLFKQEKMISAPRQARQRCARKSIKRFQSKLN